MHKKMPATTWLAWVHVFNYFTCLLDRGASDWCLFYMRDFSFCDNKLSAKNIRISQFVEKTNN